jgi:hypothetical protein
MVFNTQIEAERTFDGVAISATENRIKTILENKIHLYLK